MRTESRRGKSTAVFLRALSGQPASGRYIYSNNNINFYFYIYISALSAQQYTTFFGETATGKEMITVSVPKKSFLLYFDNYPMLAALPLEQRGLVLTVLMVFADRVWRDSAVTPEEVMEGFPGLSPEAQLVCGFMGANVLRDTRRWLDRQQNQAARRQKQERVPDSDERVKADMERARRMLEQFPEGQR